MLKLEGIKKVFNPNSVNEKIVFTDLSLTLDKGEFVTIIGGNGAGKSTLFNLVAGNFYPDAGRILLDGQDITYIKDYKRATQIGRLFQDPLRGTAPSMTIEENMLLAHRRGSQKAFSFGVSAKDRSYFRERLAMLGLGLEDRIKTKVGLLSGGQRQALTLLMATLVTPRLLLLDEHTAALDPATAEKVLSATTRIVSEHGITCMMITHNMTDSLKLGSRTLMMDKGGIVLDITGEERQSMTVQGLLERFRQKSNKELDNDRMLLED